MISLQAKGTSYKINKTIVGKLAQEISSNEPVTYIVKSQSHSSADTILTSADR